MVFSGGKIDTAVAQNGTRYADLDNAFAYRDKVSRRLHLQRQGRARARPRRHAERSDAAAGRHRRDRRRSRHLHAATTRPPSSRRSTRRRANGRSAGRDQGAAGAADREDRAGGQRRAKPVRKAAPRRDRRIQASKREPTTSSASDSDDVSPGDSIPNRCTRPRQPMLRRALDHEIGGGLARPGQLRPDAGVVGLQHEPSGSAGQ